MPLFNGVFLLSVQTFVCFVFLKKKYQCHFVYVAKGLASQANSCAPESCHILTGAGAVSV